MLCYCGCGRETTIYRGATRRFIRGHGSTPPRRGIAVTDYSIEDRGYETPCWIWRGCVDEDGYPTAKFTGRRRRVQRVVREQTYGAIPAGMDTHHRCGQRRCVNAGHLEVMRKTRHGRLASPLSEETVREIRASCEPQRALAKKYGVGRTTIQRIQNREHWRDLD